MPEDERAPDETRIEDDQYVMTYVSATEKRIYWIDPASLLIRKIQFTDANNVIHVLQQYDNFEMTNGITIPRDIQIAQPVQHQRITFSYSGVEVNVAPMEFPFNVPQSAEKIFR